jgi:hypothetical protein
MLNYILKKFKVTLYLALILMQKFHSLRICMHACIIISVEVINYITAASKNIHLIRWLFSSS